MFRVLCSSPPPKSPSTKQQQPSPSPQRSLQQLKRPRLSTDSAETPPTLRDSPKPPDKHDKPKSVDRKNSLQEERKRGQRLFGGLLSTLSQSSTGTQQKRRQDIERRQQEKAKRQKLEDEGRRQRKLQRLKELRTKQMARFEEESMRSRHIRLIATARCLQTKSEPKLYYRPWKLLPEEAECIERQVGHAEAIIAREQEELSARKGTAQKPSEDPKPRAEAQEKKEDDKATKGEKSTEQLPDSVVSDTNNDLPATAAPTQVHKDNNEGEVVLEAAEDTVIY